MILINACVAGEKDWAARILVRNQLRVAWSNENWWPKGANHNEELIILYVMADSLTAF